MMVVLAGSADGFEVRHDSEGEVGRWAEPPHLVVDPGLDERLGAPGAADAVRAAVARWAEAVPGLGLAVEVGDAQLPGFSRSGANQSSITVLTDDWPYDEHVL